ncbi:MAG TPA: MBL fold metallo-hydrolase [Saprospiraceae bacterium]|nr:MBL fold metallo-hydrolase [Saprospiraceae bacterium]
MNIHSFTFNPFAENTYILYDDSRECVIVDPGCYGRAEEKQLADFISAQKLKPVRLINTHCHIDHVFGIPFVSRHYGLTLEIHRGELIVLQFAPQSGMMFGTPVEPMPEPVAFIEEGDVIAFGNTKLEVLFTPGHSPASICFYDKEGKQLISGDVLFKGSIGRTDLPGGDYETLMKSIFTKLMILDDEVKVYPGHMESTTIGEERKRNPFILEEMARWREGEKVRW